ncbi:MAG: motility associated factor glycosyltransferase family protein [Lachnospiraceae bacterium]|nr:motility associated factor glycosyltransferase family protein [Lachnospiraceae bacterium]
MSEGVFEKNLKAMETWYPEFADLIREKEGIEDDTEVWPELSWDGQTIFRMKKGERALYLGGKRNAQRPVERWQERLGELPKYAPVFLFGVGSGAYLKALICKTKKEVNVVVYEPSVRIFLKLLQEIDLSEEIKNRPIAFIIEEINAEEFEAVMNKVLVFENVGFLIEEIHPNYKEWYAEKLTEKVRPLHRKVESIMMNKNTQRKFSTHLADNVLQNMKYICDGYHTKCLAQAVPVDGPAILVSAGPSLNKNIHELKKAKNRAFILAVDTALKPLIKAGIRPDAFMTIDAQKPLQLVEVEGAETIPVVAPTCALHKIISRQKGKKIFYDDGYAMPYHIYDMNGKEFPTVAIGGSVACSAFSMLYKMGFQTIILVGQDLAYSDNKSHADGTFQEKMPEENTEHMIMVKGNYVDKIPTRRDFRNFLEWFNQYIKGAKGHRENLRVVNATEGGAYIEGTELCTLKEIISETCHREINYSERIEQMESAFSEEERKKAAEYLHSIPNDYAEIQKAAKLLETSYRKLQKISNSGNLGQKEAGKLLKRIKKLTKRCREREAFQLIDMTMATADYIIRSEYFYEGESSEAEIKEIARKGILYNQVLQECAELLKQMAEEALLPIT